MLASSLSPVGDQAVFRLLGHVLESLHLVKLQATKLPPEKQRTQA